MWVKLSTIIPVLETIIEDKGKVAEIVDAIKAQRALELEEHKKPIDSREIENIVDQLA